MLLDMRVLPELSQVQMPDSLLEVVNRLVRRAQRLPLLFSLLLCPSRRQLARNLDVPLVNQQGRLAPADQRAERRITPLELPVSPLKHRVIPALAHLEPLDRLPDRKIPERVVILPPPVGERHDLAWLAGGGAGPDEFLAAFGGGAHDRHCGDGALFACGVGGGLARLSGHGSALRIDDL